MPEKLHRHFQWVGLGVYLLSLLIVSVSFRSYALKPLWMAWGIGTVCFFFLTTWFFFRQWRHDETKKFIRKVFWIALGIRAVYVGTIILYYYYQTGLAMEYQAADSMSYHQWAIALAKLAREGEFGIIFRWLNANTMGFSDQGYVLYLTTLYTCFDNNILGPRLLKALMSAYMCVAIYKLASRETELIFLTTLALERMDYLVRSKRYTFWNIAFPILLTALTFGFRTIVGMILILCFILFILFQERPLMTKKAKIVTIGAVALVSLVFLFTPIGREMLIMFRINFLTGEVPPIKYEQMGLKYAEYASGKYLAPGFFTLPLTNLVEVANENQKMMNGTFFVKNYLAFFALWCIVVAFREKKWRDFSLIGSFAIIYALCIAFSFAFNSERYHLPVMPCFLIMAAFAMTHFRKKDFAVFYTYNALLVIAIVAWNYIKLDGRGLFF